MITRPCTQKYETKREGIYTNRVTIIGNLCADPTTRTISTGNTVCSFTVAVNRRKSGNSNQPEADFFRVSAWDKLADNCQRYLAKGRKVAVVGSVSVSTYEGKDGTRFSLDVRADEVEFLSAKEQDDAGQHAKSQPKPAPDGFTQVDDEDFDSLPF